MNQRHKEGRHSTKTGKDFMGGSIKQAGGPGSSGSTQAEHGNRTHRDNPGGANSCVSCGGNGGGQHKAGGSY